MGFFADGVWQDVDMRTQGGQFVRKPTAFHNYITADGSPGPTGKGGFAAEPGRYHLYVSLACPWAHRTLIFRKLKKLEDVISVSIVEPINMMSVQSFTRYSAVCPPLTTNPTAGKVGVCRRSRTTL